MTSRLSPSQLWVAMPVVAALIFGVGAGWRPAVAVVAALGLGFVGVVLANLTSGLCLFTAVSFVELLPFQGGAALSFAKVAGLLLALSWVATEASRSGGRPGFLAAHPAFAYTLLLFLAWAALSLLWSENAAAGLESLSRYALNAFLFVIVYAAIRERRHVLLLLAAFVAGAAAAAAFGFVAGPAPDTPDRLSGSFGQPDDLAVVLVAGVVLAAGVGAVSRYGARLAAVAAGTVCLGGIFLTLSRGGLVALAFVIIAGVAFGGRWRRLVAALGVMVVCVSVGYFAFVASPAARERVTTIQGGTGRADIWTVGWRMVQAHPLVGVGTGNFPTSSIHYLLQPGAIQRDEFIVDSPKVAHNVYLQVLAELGIPGLILFLTILGFSLSCAARAARRFMRQGDVPLELLARAVVVGLVGTLAADFFLSRQYSKQLWLLLALGPALLAIASSAAEEDAEPERPERSPLLDQPPAAPTISRQPAPVGS